MKDEGADCSGSTWKIYQEAGFSYAPYLHTAGFKDLVGTDQNFIKGKHFFKEVSSPQTGDVGWWKGHMAIYDKDAGTTPRGQVGHLWSASNPKGSGFGVARTDFYDFKDGKGQIIWYRYWKAP